MQRRPIRLHLEGRLPFRVNEGERGGPLDEEESGSPSAPREAAGLVITHVISHYRSLALRQALSVCVCVCGVAGDS